MRFNFRDGSCIKNNFSPKLQSTSPDWNNSIILFKHLLPVKWRYEKCCSYLQHVPMFKKKSDYRYLNCHPDATWDKLLEVKKWDNVLEGIQLLVRLRTRFNCSNKSNFQSIPFTWRERLKQFQREKQWNKARPIFLQYSSWELIDLNIGSKQYFAVKKCIFVQKKLSKYMYADLMKSSMQRRCKLGPS